MSNSKLLEQDTQNLIRFGMTEDSIRRRLKEKEKDEVLLEEIVSRTCESYPDFDLIQFFMGSKVIVDKDGEDNQLYLLNEKNKETRTIDRSRLNAMINPKLRWSHRVYTSKFVYNPYTPFKLRKHDGEWEYNLYDPPEWSTEYFRSGGRIKFPIIKQLPSVYDKFYSHLFEKKDGSYDYNLDWMANMLRSRNYCFLVTIGNQGIGKGVHGDIMRELVGKNNYTKTDKKLITKDFNGQIKNKRLIYLDEVKVTSEDQENKLKSLANDYVEVENKGKDAILAQNFASIYYSSNNLDSLRIPADDRRYSILQVTDVKLTEVMTQEEIRSLTKPENIAQLAYFLMNRDIDEKQMIKVFISERTELVRTSSLKDWQDWILLEYAVDMQGKFIPVSDVTAAIEDRFDYKRGPGRPALTSLSQLYPNVFKVKKIKDKGSGKQVWGVEFE